MAAMIDHTLLRPDAKPADIVQLCAEAVENGFFSVCVNPVFVPLAVKQLKGTAVKVCTVIGFPLGACRTDYKVFESKKALADGADELDMVIALHAIKSGNRDVARQEIEDIKKLCKKRTLKVILETCLLSKEEIRTACEDAMSGNCDFVKTSTGFSSSGATTEAVAIMRSVVGARIGVKASGGIKTTQAALSMIEAGANRIGTSSGIEILKGLNKE
jgi:deoxyribose-phosphate aldolase